jgi:hypothetical protein
MPTELPLRDIHLPDSVSWWPPAPGWWLLLVLLVVIGVLIGFWLKRPPRVKLNKGAVAEVKQLQARYPGQLSEQQCLKELSSVLRRIGISYLGREHHAGITGQEWYRLLNGLTDEPLFNDEQMGWLIAIPYQADCDLSEQQVSGLLDRVNRWARKLPASAGGAHV